mgnify:FL=1
MKRIFLACLALAVPAMADELDRSTVGQITWTVKDWPADGWLMKPKGIGNLTAEVGQEMPYNVIFKKIK